MKHHAKLYNNVKTFISQTAMYLPGTRIHVQWVADRNPDSVCFAIRARVEAILARPSFLCSP